MNISIEFTALDMGRSLDRSRGHIDFSGDAEVISTRTEGDGQSSLVFFALIDLMRLLRKIKEENSERVYQFHISSSSFIMDFKHEDNALTISSGEISLGTFPLDEVASNVEMAIDELFHTQGISSENLGSVASDFVREQHSFKMTFGNSGEQ